MVLVGHPLSQQALVLFKTEAIIILIWQEKWINSSNKNLTTQRKNRGDQKENRPKEAPRKEVYDIWLGQVNELDKTIDDYNFAIDKNSSDSDTEEIEVLAFGLKEDNEQYVNEVNQIVIRKSPGQL